MSSVKRSGRLDARNVRVGCDIAEHVHFHAGGLGNLRELAHDAPPDKSRCRDEHHPTKALVVQVSRHITQNPGSSNDTWLHQQLHSLHLGHGKLPGIGKRIRHDIPLTCGFFLSPSYSANAPKR